MTVGRLTFRFAEAVEELRTLAAIAGNYLDPNSIYLLDNLETTLQGIRDAAPGHVYQAVLPVDRPLRTRVSDGGYEVGGGGSLRLRAEVSAIWDIEPLGPRGHRNWTARTFRLGGLASTVVTIVNEDTGAPIVRWHMEIGDQGSPGCFFHVQLPVTTPVPRLPGYVATIPVAIEYVISELFQDDWDQTASADTPSMNRWRVLQSRRYSLLFDWNKSCAVPPTGSPWVALKRSKPPNNLFST